MNGKPHGAHTGYYADGVVRHRFNYFQGGKTGINLVYYHNGQVQVKEVVSRSGFDVTEESFTETGKKIDERHFFKSSPQGKWISYFDDGKTFKEVEQYDKGKLHGLRVAYFKNGEKATEETYQFGLITGLVKNYMRMEKCSGNACIVVAECTVFTRPIISMEK